MTIKRTLLSILCTGFCCLVTYGQSMLTDQAIIEEGITTLYAAMVSKDRPVLERLTAKDLTYGHSSGTIENKTQYVEAVMTGPFEFLSLEAVDPSVQITGNTAIARHIFKARGKNDGVETDVRIGVMMAWLKLDGKWLLLARQAYKL